MYTSVRKRWTVRLWAPRHLKWTCSSLRLVTIENFLFPNSSRQHGMGPSWSPNPQKSWPDLQEGGTRLESPSKEKTIQDLAVAGTPPAFVPVATNAVLQEQPRLRQSLWAFQVVNISSWFAFVCDLSSTWWLVSITHLKGEKRNSVPLISLTQ